ncbi:MAG: hypothetical protein K6E94_00230 [Elusimicrobiaceae bacterium]|nr:hypothetical protein [Elusimicrobiaceae bacterium]
MINKLLTFAAKVKDFLKNKKVYLAALIIILQALLTYIEQVISLTGLTDFIMWCKGLAANEATLHLLEGLGLFGLRAVIGNKTETKK